MALHRLEEVSIGAADPEHLGGFYRDIGMIGGERIWGTADRPGQIRLAEAPYRQLLSLRILCEDVEPGAVADVAPQPQRTMNFPGEPNRLGERAEVIFRPADMDDVVAGWNRAHA